MSSSSSSLGQPRPRPARRFVSVDDAFCRSASPDQNNHRASPSSDKTSEAAPLALLRRFYETLLAPAFPLEEERDALDDWLECFAAQRRVRCARSRRASDDNECEVGEGTDKCGEESGEELEGPAMDVILMVRDGREAEGADEGTWGGRRGGPSLLRSQSSGFGGLYAPAEDSYMTGDVVGSGSHHCEPRRGSSFFGEIGASIPEEEKARSPSQRRTVAGDGGEEEKKEEDDDPEKVDDEGGRSLEGCTVVGGAAVEYYPRSRVGLLSYVVLHADCRGRGLARPLHDEALARLEALARRYYGPSRSEEPMLRAVFAETNTAAAGDVAPEMALRRHRALYNLGYRLVQFPYAQPPLSTANVDAAFDDIVLLVYFPYERWQLRDVGEDDDAARFCRWYLEWRRREGRGEDDRDDRAVAMDADVPFGYVEEFYRSVFGDGGGGTPDYRAAEYYRLVRWFARGRRGSSEGVAVSLCRPTPWEDCKEALRLEWKASDPEEVAGADVG